MPSYISDFRIRFGFGDRQIMLAEWTPIELLNAASGYLRFTPQQAEIIRAEVSRRNAHKETAAVAGPSPLK